MNYVDISWMEIEYLAGKIAEDIKASPIIPKYLYAIDQQSLVPAMMISRKLGNIPITDNCRKPFILFVSNFVNTGNSLAKVTDKSNCFTTAVLVLKDSSTFKPDFLGKIREAETFYIFPWDQIHKSTKTVEPNDFSDIIKRIKGK